MHYYYYNYLNSHLSLLISCHLSHLPSLWSCLSPLSHLVSLFSSFLISHLLALFSSFSLFPPFSLSHLSPLLSSPLSHLISSNLSHLIFCHLSHLIFCHLFSSHLSHCWTRWVCFCAVGLFLFLFLHSVWLILNHSYCRYWLYIGGIKCCCFSGMTSFVGVSFGTWLRLPASALAWLCLPASALASVVFVVCIFSCLFSSPATSAA